LKCQKDSIRPAVFTAMSEPEQRWMLQVQMTFYCWILLCWSYFQKE